MSASASLDTGAGMSGRPAGKIDVLVRLLPHIAQEATHVSPERNARRLQRKASPFRVRQADAEECGALFLGSGWFRVG